MEGAFLTNFKNAKVLDVQGNVDAEQRHTIFHKKHGGLNQQWEIVYVDEWKGEPTKGEFSPEFGLYVERPFYVVSMLSQNRFLDWVSNNLVIKIRNGRKSQSWWFDQKTYTIRSSDGNKSWDIHNSGKSNHMQIYSTSSQWW
jgi:hypothetical protein